MKEDKYTASQLLTGAGGLMTVSGVLMALCSGLTYGGILWAAAACMFFAARSFRIAEDQKETEKTEDL